VVGDGSCRILDVDEAGADFGKGPLGRVGKAQARVWRAATCVGVVEVVGSSLVLEQRSEVSDGRRRSRFWHGFMREEGLISSSPRRIMTFVAGSLMCGRSGVGWKGKERERKGRDESMQRHTRQVMHLSPRQGNGGGMCNNINRRANGFWFRWCVAGRALKPGVWLAPVRADLRYNSVPADAQPSPAESLVLPCLVCSSHGQGFMAQESHSSDLARGRARGRDCG
jgi:hypothetical protein